MPTTSSPDKGQIEITVIVKVNPCRSLPIAPFVDAGRRKDVRERSIALILVQIRRFPIIIVDEEIEISIVIEIAPDRSSEGKSHAIEPCGERGVSKDRVAQRGKSACKTQPTRKKSARKAHSRG